MDDETPGQSPPARDVAVNRRTVRLGPKFAGTIASRLDAHAGSADTRRTEDERKIIALAQKTLSKRAPDTWAVNFLTQAVEMHTKQFGFSKAIYDELFRLNEARSQVEEEPPAPVRPAPRATSARPELSRFLAGEGPKKARSAESTSSGPGPAKPVHPTSLAVGSLRAPLADSRGRVSRALKA
jgi:hypothetical protein